MVEKYTPYKGRDVYGNSVLSAVSWLRRADSTVVARDKPGQMARLVSLDSSSSARTTSFERPFRNFESESCDGRAFCSVREGSVQVSVGGVA
jgi:hypothetical protein